MNAVRKLFAERSVLQGANAAYLEDRYAAWLRDPAALDPEWRAYFDELTAGRAATPPAARPRQAPPAARRVTTAARMQTEVLQLINAYRVRGHQLADLDPLRICERPPVPDLDPAFHGLGEAHLDQVFATGSLVGPPQRSLREILDLLTRVYTGTIGAEYMHITDTEQKRWIQQRLEGAGGNPGLDAGRKRHVLERLTAAEGLERYLHTRYLGQKRFSLEGGDALIPLLDELILHGGTTGVTDMVIGMAHRGRLNVLINTLGKQPCELFQEFEGKQQLREEAGSGDVKYHMGFSANADTPGGPVHLSLAFNPSHLEIIGPVVEGSVRARQQRVRDRRANRVIPVLLHGDSAFAGQGVVMETFNMSQARGYSTGGTVHIVINNQIGFTTSNPVDTRSTLYCTDVAKMVQAPIFHVNGDDPEAVVFVARLALDFRMTFRKDVVIDMVCYRRQGHNEADEPAVTQPLMYRAIRQHPSVRQRYAERLQAEGLLGAEEALQLQERYRASLDQCLIVSPHSQAGIGATSEIDWSPYGGTDWEAPVDTTIGLPRLQDLAQRMLALPTGFELHPRVANIMADRAKMAAGALAMDWGFAENLAYATLLTEGYAVRISGQDSGRGTFFHRHAVLHNQQDGEVHIPLQHLGADQAKCIIIDSVLSEEAVLAFEYGFATTDPEALVIWEAQFGDFANGAQVVIDQFISSGELKWGRKCGLTLFLPHGFEGQGAEHSSARLERFLQLSAEHNIQVCVPSTPAQMFHLLRRQMLRPYRKPLIVMTPKSLLRHQLSVSSLEDITAGAFQPLIPDVDEPDPSRVHTVVLCAGKVYYDLLEARRKHECSDTAILRVEQLYPFPRDQLVRELELYPEAMDIVWCQEEPRNQGAWYQSQHNIMECMRSAQHLRYAGRAASAAPAVGHFQTHIEQQRTLVAEALRLGGES
jgi:2-oxoglutarate dehydrogenase E1 component